MMKTQNATVAAVERPARGHYENLSEYNPGWDAQARNCPCNGCGSAPRCAREEIACRAWRAWLMTGRSVKHLERVPDARITNREE
jgi:hypothetical protein